MAIIFNMECKYFATVTVAIPEAMSVTGRLGSLTLKQAFLAFLLTKSSYSSPSFNPYAQQHSVFPSPTLLCQLPHHVLIR